METLAKAKTETSLKRFKSLSVLAVLKEKRIFKFFSFRGKETKKG